MTLPKARAHGVVCGPSPQVSIATEAAADAGASPAAAGSIAAVVGISFTVHPPLGKLTAVESATDGQEHTQ